MPWVVEMTGYDPVAGAEKTVRFAAGEGIAFTDVPYAPGALMRWASASQRIEFGSNGMVELGGSTGEIMIANFPDTAWEEAPWDDLAGWVWQNRTATLWSVPGQSWAAKTHCGTATMQQPVANLDVGGSISSVLRFPLKDPRAALKTPLQPEKFAGTNVGPVGVEGGEELKGRPKPVMYGLVSNISPPRVNSSLLIYQLADRAVTVLCVRDGGASLTAGTVRASLASLQGNIPTGGRYDIYAGAEGTFIRLGSNPIFGIACDADEAFNVPNQSHVNIWARIRGQRIGSAVNGASMAAADAVDSAGAGFYWDGETTQEEALAEVLGSFSGYEVLGNDGVWAVHKLVAPAGEPVIELEQLGETTEMKAKSRALIGLTKVRPGYAPDGAPPFRVNVRWGKSYTVMAESDFAGVAATRLKDKFGQEFRTASVVDNAIWNPAAQTGLWKNAPELTIDTGYQPDALGLTSPGALAEATRIMALLGPVRGQYQVKFHPEVGDALLPGQVVKLTYPRMGLAGGALFRILECGIGVNNGRAEADLVIGLQS